MKICNGLAITYWNNWMQDKEITLLAIDLNYQERNLTFSLGIIGFGLVISWSF